jgi:ribonuclease P/MRP protein subunit RPP40
VLIPQLDVLLPKKSWQTVSQKVEDRLRLKYFRVSMPLIDVVSGDFFNQYIKTGNLRRYSSSTADSQGNVLMLSSGRRRVDNRFSLINGTIYGRLAPSLICSGVLKLDLDKETYERCGLSGKPARSDGRYHVVARYCKSGRLPYISA